MKIIFWEYIFFFLFLNHKRRGCYFNSERQLQFFKIYTETNCWLECLTNFTLFYCGCTFYYMPRFNDTPLCGMGSIDCFYSAKADLQLEVISISQNTFYKSICHCLPSCVSISYKAEVSQSSFIDGQIINELSLS